MEIKLVPTHKYKTSVVFFDDDKNFLNYLESHLTSDMYKFHFVSQYDDFIKLFNQSEAAKKNIPSILVKIDDELTDLNQHEAFDFDFSKFETIHALKDKEQEISVAFIDNDLGALNGIKICTELKTDSKKILLTGTSDLRNAIAAMSEKHIANYVPKIEEPNSINNSDDDLITRINRVIEHFTDDYFIDKNYYRNKFLVNGAFKNLLKKITTQYNIVEYSLFGKDQFRFIDKNGYEMYFKCWVASDFEKYSIDHYDDLDEGKNIFLAEVKNNFKFPIESTLVNSSKYEHLYYCIY